MIKNELARYDDYRDSEVERLGNIPRHWEISRIKEKGSVKARVGWKALKASEYIDDGFAFLSTPNIKNKNIDFKNVNYITYERYLESPEIMLKEDDILLVKDGSTLGIVNIVTCLPRDTTVNSSIAVLRFNKTIFNKYLFYQIESKYIQDKIQIKKGGMGVPHLFQQDINNFIITVPQYNEQKVIADYLDIKTSQIDRKIDLLTQKATKYGNLKQSLINEIVTRGLDKTVVMKDSGVDWMGGVPKHWGINKLAQSFSQIGSGTTPKSGIDVYYEGGTINWINTGDLNDGILFSCKRTVTEKALKDYSLNVYPAGSIIIAMYGATIGKVSISMIEGCTNQACCVLNKSKVIDTNFLFYWFISKREFIISLSYGGGQPNISQDTVKSLRVISPLISEQKSIADYLDIKTAHIDRIIETINTQIDKLKELRKTLINDVVTGKIKVYQEGV